MNKYWLLLLLAVPIFPVFGFSEEECYIYHSDVFSIVKDNSGCYWVIEQALRQPDLHLSVIYNYNFVEGTSVGKDILYVIAK